MQLFPNHPSDGNLLLVEIVPPVELFQDVLHLLVCLNLSNPYLPQLAQASLHALIQANLLRSQIILINSHLLSCLVQL